MLLPKTPNQFSALPNGDVILGGVGVAEWQLSGIRGAAKKVILAVNIIFNCLCDSPQAQQPH